MQVTKGTWRMCEQCVPGSLFSSLTREPGNEATLFQTLQQTKGLGVCEELMQFICTLIGSVNSSTHWMFSIVCSARTQLQ